MAWDPVRRIPCGGCVNGYLKRDDKAVPHVDCDGTGKRVDKRYGRPIKAESRRGQPSPWVSKSKATASGKKK